MRCPNCLADDPKPPPSDNGTTTCPKCGHRFPVDESEPEPVGPATPSVVATTR